jgi:uncharacterized protein YyaL (SSP411 family)
MKLELPPTEEIEQLPPDGGSKYNRLIFEKSPYLLQHAANPVDWYPWSEDAFQQAYLEDKPLFLSIGYATCHWCHVMERESFEDREVAEIINQHFIPVKVDREERPDIDQIYMAVSQAVTGSGGWPLTVLLTPDKKPFFVGTYFPKESRFGRVGLMELIPKVDDLWVNKRDELLESAENITGFLQETNQTIRGKLDPGVIKRAYDQLSSRFDSVLGGFGAAPKFPSPHNLIFLTRYWKETGDPVALEMVETTLQKMRLGGVYDQIGFGFHRYATDAAWRLPHFEKMLYDQAMLTLAYTEAYQATGKDQYAAVVHEILTYVLRDMTAPEGGFFSAEDADSEGEEGLFYLWKLDELRENLGPEAAQLFTSLFNIREEGNYADEATRELTGRNILFLNAPLEELAEEVNFQPDELLKLWEEVRSHLFQVREARIHPLKDDKILTDWNGLMIAALAKAGAALGEPVYVQAARKAVDFIWNHLRNEEGKLLKRYRDEDAGLSAHLDDYAFMIWGLLELHQAEFQTAYLQKALTLTEILIEDYWDEDVGGFFFTAKGQRDLIHRGKEIYDGAIPSGNSVAYSNFVRLGRILLKPEYEEKAQAIGEAFSVQVNQLSVGHTQLISGFLLAESPSSEIVIAGNLESPDAIEMLRRVREHYSPHQVVLLRPTDPDDTLFDLNPVLQDQIPIEGKATAYVCKDFQCNAPTTSVEEMIKLLESN